MILLIGMWTNLTKNPMKPMMTNPAAVALAIFANSFLSGLEHFRTKYAESAANFLMGSIRKVLTSDMLKNEEKKVTEVKSLRCLCCIYCIVLCCCVVLSCVALEGKNNNRNEVCGGHNGIHSHKFCYYQKDASGWNIGRVAARWRFTFFIMLSHPIIRHSSLCITPV